MAKSIIQSTNDIAEVFGGPALDINRPYWTLFADSATRYPHNEAVVSLWQKDWRGNDHALRWTYAELLRHCEIVCAWLDNQGCRSGMRLAVFLGNSAEWVLFMWAAARMGLTFIPLDPMSLMTEAEYFMKVLSPDVVVVYDDEAARQFDQVARHNLGGDAACISCADREISSWHSLPSIMATTNTKSHLSHGLLPLEDDETRVERLIFFTSGTTGLPKGCPLTGANVWSQTWDWEPPAPGSFDRWLLHTPVSHILGCNHALRMFRAGGTVVFSNNRFDVNSTFPALQQEKCTKMAAVPTLVQALLSNDSFDSPDKLALHYITLGGTLITPEDIRLCKNGLGVQAAVQGYGLTEGMPLACWHSCDPLLAEKNGYHPGVGRALPGANFRVCDPKSLKILGRNEDGELHVSGTSVISGYLHDIEAEKFYVDSNGIRWFKTGDQARIDEDGILHIIGRYKDLIIRGGVNISPAKIERAIWSLSGVTAHVVAYPDKIAGQVPVAVLKATDGIDKSMVLEISRSLGPQYALDAVYLLSDLSLDSFPTTSIGKIKKQELQKLVMDFKNLQGSAPLPGTPIRGTLSQSDGKPACLKSNILVNLSQIWEHMVGFVPGIDDSVLGFADSITILRVCAEVHNMLTTPLYLQDIPNYKTIRQQAELLSQRQTGQMSRKHLTVDTRFSLDTVVLADGIPDRLVEIETSSTYPLAQVNMPISDVEAYIPISDSLMPTVTGTRPQSFHHRFIARINSATPSAVQGALETAISTRQTFRSLLGCLLDGTPYHIVVKPTQNLFKLIIKSLVVQSTKDRERVQNDISAKTFSELLMLQIKIITCKDDECVHIIFDFNHSAFDLLTLFAFYQDVDRLLYDPHTQLMPLTPFERYADVTYLYRDSALASTSVAFHVSKLQTLFGHKESLWPPQIAPGWMIGRDQDSALFHQREVVRANIWGSSPPMPSLLENPTIRQTIDCPALEVIKVDYGVPAKIVFQAAIKLFNVITTRQPYAVLGVLDDARSWPFMPEWLANSLPSPASISGPTVESLLSITRIDITSLETVSGYLRRIHEEWSECRQHAHAPWSRIRRELGQEGKDLLPIRQMFTWDSSLDMLNYTHIQAMARRDWPDCGVFWNGVQLDPMTLEFYGSWDTAQMNHLEFEKHCDRSAMVLKRLTKLDNLEKSLADVFVDLING